MLGIYKEATPSPSKSAYHMLDILWKEEILKMLGTFRHYGIRVETATGTKFMHTANRSGGVSGLYTKSATGRTMRKPDLIRNLINRVGVLRRLLGSSVTCSFIIDSIQRKLLS